MTVQQANNSAAKPLVSVIMNCLNGARYLSEAIKSVYAQTYPNWEIIFWDNASIDDSSKIAKSYGGRVRYFRSDTTYSLGKARNLAVSQVRGEYVAILDVDDIWFPHKLERQIPLFEADPKVGLVFSNSQFFDENGDCGNHFQQAPPHRGYVFGALLRDNFVSSETMVYRRSALEGMQQVFNENLSMVMDFDLSLRVALKHKLDYIGDCLSKWRMHNESESSKKRFLIPKENRWMLEKLVRNTPEIAWRYQEAISAFKDNINYQLGLEKWHAGTKVQAYV